MVVGIILGRYGPEQNSPVRPCMTIRKARRDGLEAEIVIFQRLMRAIFPPERVQGSLLKPETKLTP